MAQSTFAGFVGGLLLVVCISRANCSYVPADYKENLHISVLHDGSLLFRAEYTVIQDFVHKCTQTTAGSSVCVTHSGKLPTSHISLFTYNKLQRYHVHLTRGGWKNLHWGSSPHYVPPDGGVFAVAMHQNATLPDFTHVRNAIGASFCSSFSADSSMTKPYADDYIRMASQGPNSNEKHFAQLFPTETVCTENVVPISMILQNANKGLGVFLDSNILLHTPWHALSAVMEDMTKEAHPSVDDGHMRFRFQAVVQFVLPKSSTSLPPMLAPVLKSVGHITVIVPAEEYEDDVEAAMTKAFSASAVLSSATSYDYALRRVQKFELDSSADSQVIPKLLAVAASLDKRKGNHEQCSSASTNEMQSAAGVSITARVFDSHASDLKVKAVLRNGSPCDVTGRFQLLMTPYFRPLTHSITVDDENYLLDMNNSFIVARTDDTTGTLGGDLMVPAGKQVSVAFRSNKELLHFQSYPPDASRGFDIPPCIFRYQPKCPEAVQLLVGRDRTIFSEGGLTVLPFPDASMPFNVITLVSTVVAFVIGSIINVLVRRSWKKPRKPLLARLLSAFSSKFKK